MPHPLREYGYGSSDPFVRSVPRVLGPATGLPPCPGCGCVTLFELEVDVNHPRLRGDGTGLGRYVGCPACPFATPMMMTATERTDDGHTKDPLDPDTRR